MQKALKRMVEDQERRDFYLHLTLTLNENYNTIPEHTLNEA